MLAGERFRCLGASRRICFWQVFRGRIAVVGAVGKREWLFRTGRIAIIAEGARQARANSGWRFVWCFVEIRVCFLGKRPR